MFSSSSLDFMAPEIRLHDNMLRDVLVLFITLLIKIDFHWMTERKGKDIWLLK